MDTTVPEIVFDDKGVCQFCGLHDELVKIYPDDRNSRKEKLELLLEEIKRTGKGKKYDCVCGVSGGRDSSWLLLKVVELGLRPLAVHFDNGWNSEIAVSNIKKTCEKLNVDLETYVVDWHEFRDIQLSMLKGSTPDVEVPTDVAIHTVLHHYAAKENIKFVLNGHSFRTEGISPRGWTYMDGLYIESVHKKFGSAKFETFPNFKMWDYFYYSYVKRVKVYPIINLLEYEHESAMKELEQKLDWKYYGGHHHENYYTKFIQSYLLPKKFNIDKRKTELSALIRSGQVSRDEAIATLSKSEYEFDKTLIDYILPKLEITKTDWDNIFSMKPKSFLDYRTYYPLVRFLKVPIRIAAQLGLVPRLLYFKFLG
ncbi:N-acetyl sugar amidotransferase [Bdellovibrio reynosensis]|uniref:N-acetyl sugar amidotransferase n=2 Tax=Bdellovibrio reynosensis TaxID=2835041 RepID=A0ABY4CEZ5_9BACT|nr:N-acetyl sugar amidotransferase [Bdellovibrio reynosensis]UOF02236.1 N-acetyl sugar amidotransferase [Bdellovibrio reynosensis]